MIKTLLLLLLSLSLSASTFVPDTSKYDWVELNSGEWLKGEIKVLYDDVLEFDSDELDLLELDFKDVKSIYSAHNISLFTQTQGTLSGKLSLTGKTIYIKNSTQNVAVKRCELVSLAKSSSKESDYWSASVTFGLNFQGGNTQQFTYSAKANAARRNANSRIIFDYLGNIASTTNPDTNETIETSNNNRLSASYDYYITSHFFWRPVFGEFFKDSFQNLDLKYSVGTALGYDLLYTNKTNLSFSVGPAYSETKYVAVEIGENQNPATYALALTIDYDYEIKKDVDFIISYSSSFVNEESGRYTHHLITTLETEILSDFVFDTSVVWDRVQNPITTEDGSKPKQDDTQLLFTVGYSY